jgi:small acid-soluble spore protein E (minor gamma-type SASP)
MAKNNKTQAGTNFQSAQGGQSQFGTEFASETNVQKVKQQNAQSAQGGQGQFGTEFASETNAQEVRRQNQQAEANKNKNS